MRQIAGAEEASHRRNENEEREQRCEQSQPDVAGDRPAIIGGELFRRLPNDFQACAHPGSILPASATTLARRGGKRHPREAEFTLLSARRGIATAEAATHAAAQQRRPMKESRLLTLDAMRDRVSENGKLSAGKIETEQHAVHGLAWLATYVEAIKEMAAYANRMQEDSRFGETEQLLTRIGIGEYLDQIFSAIPMNQGEIVRPADFGLAPDQIAPLRNEAVEALIASGATRENRAALAALIGEAREGLIGDPGLDETFEAIRGEMRRFADAEVVPHAQGWHRANAYIPLEIIEGLSAMGVFGLTI